MKLKIFAAAAVAASLAMPVLAQDKSATEAPKADAPKAQAKSKAKPHSHMKEKTGIEPSDQATGASKPVDKTKHSHPKEK
ncbi:MAG: hypothetical protein JSS40_05295 [Proteobacteria bacterium]|nr:hypothetical protein [Pseudomonadota bacterium]